MLTFCWYSRPLCFCESFSYFRNAQVGSARQFLKVKPFIRTNSQAPLCSETHKKQFFSSYFIISCQPQKTKWVSSIMNDFVSPHIVFMSRLSRLKLKATDDEFKHSSRAVWVTFDWLLQVLNSVLKSRCLAAFDHEVQGQTLAFSKLRNSYHKDSNLNRRKRKLFHLMTSNH